MQKTLPDSPPSKTQSWAQAVNTQDCPANVKRANESESLLHLKKESSFKKTLHCSLKLQELLKCKQILNVRNHDSEEYKYKVDF